MTLPRLSLGAHFAPALSALLLVACSDSSKPIAPPADASVRVVHASPDAPSVDIKLDGSVAVTDLDYGQVTDAIVTEPGVLNVTVFGRLPGTERPAVIGPADITLAAGGAYAVLAVNEVSAIEPLVVARETSPVSTSSALAGSTCSASCTRCCSVCDGTWRGSCVECAGWRHCIQGSPWSCDYRRG